MTLCLPTPGTAHYIIFVVVNFVVIFSLSIRKLFFSFQIVNLSKKLAYRSL